MHQKTVTHTNIKPHNFNVNSNSHGSEIGWFGWAKTRQDHVEGFWKALDYGYIKERLDVTFDYKEST